MKRWSGAFVLGAGVTAAALAFGSRPLGVAGVGLLVAAGSTRVWAGLVRGAITVLHTVQPAPAVEGDHVVVGIETRRASRVPVGFCAVRGTFGRLGVRELRLRGHGRVAFGRLDLGTLPRGRFQLTDPRVVLGDFLGLESVELPSDFGSVAVVVQPRLVALDGVFSDAGRLGGDARRLLLRRSAGFDFHSVREYEQGESLRRVHWPSSARRGELMVRELEDGTRDGVVVLLDCDPGGATGDPPDSSFDTAVRAAGSLVRAHVVNGESATLVTTGLDQSRVTVRSGDANLEAALGVLAAVEPDAPYGLTRGLRHDDAPLAGASELVVVTATVDASAAAALLAIASRGLVSVVWIDARSFAGIPTRADPGVLRLSAGGIPVAVVRRGDDLADALSARASRVLAHG